MNWHVNDAEFTSILGNPPRAVSMATGYALRCSRRRSRHGDRMASARASGRRVTGCGEKRRAA
jgi:hypothetical protein